MTAHLPKFRNAVLAAVPPEDMRHLAGELQRIMLKPKDLLQYPAARIEDAWVYFPENAVASNVVLMKSGLTVEVGIVGREGFVGFAGVLNLSAPTGRSLIQMPGVGYRIKASVLRDHFDRSEGFRSCMLRAMQGYIAQVSQTAACNRVHALPLRLARWLLMCSDRTQGTELCITHGFLALMLGSQRPTVTLAISKFKKDGLIDSRRGHLKILDLARLRTAACECYATVQNYCVGLGLFETEEIASLESSEKPPSPWIGPAHAASPRTLRASVLNFPATDQVILREVKPVRSSGS